MSTRGTLHCAFYSLLLFVFSIHLNGQSLTFDKRSYIGKASQDHTDFNGDGREDFVYQVTGGFAVLNSNGDGSYVAPVTYALSGGQSAFYFAIGDFNRDGKADLIVTDQKNLYEYINNGDGTFHLQFTAPQKFLVNGLLAGDFNHDGKMDIAFSSLNSSLNQEQLTVWFGNGDNGFTTGPTTNIPIGGEMYIGDFDGDGKADIIAEQCDISCAIYIYYGDSAGHFPGQVNINSGHGAHVKPGDLNGDGKSDLVGDSYIYSTNGMKFYQDVFVFYGNSGRTWTETSIPTARCTQVGPATVADFNGDGIPDILVPEYSDCSGGGPYYLAVLTGKGGGAFNPEQTIYSSNEPIVLEDVVRADRNTKPDIAITQQTSSSGSSTTFDLTLLLNTNSGNFFSCAPPNAFTGINVCSPAVTGAGSPVKFSIGAAGQTPMRKVEVWVDGVKKAEQLDGFSKYSFMDKSVALANGSHAVTIFAAGWDNWLERKDLTLSVGGACAAPSSTSVSICQPAPGSTVGSPVQVIAKGGASVTFMEAWVDGVKRFQNSGNTLSTSIPLSVGSHSLTVFAKVGSTVTGKQTETFTVH
ncbi:MAG: conserved repeat domain [Candidatus Angelobacter sp.]|nr:conserved repeat domain [Candidatus Angelobacter sp.]